MRKIYLDYAATTPVEKKVLAAMLPYFGEKFGNASSLHNFGREASMAVENARQETADFFGAGSEEIIFTSGATESNNLAIKGVVRAYCAIPENKNKKPHIITAAIEHHCVLNTVKNLEKEGLIEADFIKPEKNGIINPRDLKKAIKANTILISVMYVNNEIGTVQPITEIGKIIHGAWNMEHGTRNKNYPIFHTDATQAVNYFDCNVNKLGADLLSMSAHKIYGPKGVGALYVKKGTKIKMIQDGGEQERGLRAGTINSAGIVGLGAAIKAVKDPKSKAQNKKIEKLRDYLIKRVLKEVPETKLNGSKLKRSPNNANFSFKDVEGESLIMLLDQEGIAGSTGSACSSGSLEPSHVLLSLGLKAEQAHGSLRLTLGKFTTQEEVSIAADKIKMVVEKLRKISGKILDDYYKKHNS
jgi:cysteine desulfurase